MAEWRFETVIAAIDEVLRVEIATRPYWSLQKLVSGACVEKHNVQPGGMPNVAEAEGVHDVAAGDEGQAGFEAEKHIELVDTAMSSAWFWGYCKMMKMISEVLLHMRYWIESCPCRSTSVFGCFGKSAWHRQNALAGDFAADDAPGDKSPM
eukprot:15275134-Alexandrium_andersonii.AAC.1